jgi:hypothetical protein
MRVHARGKYIWRTLEILDILGDTGVDVNKVVEGT